MKLLHIWSVEALLGRNVGEFIAYLVGKDTIREKQGEVIA